MDHWMWFFFACLSSGSLCDVDEDLKDDDAQNVLSFLVMVVLGSNDTFESA